MAELEEELKVRNGSEGVFIRTPDTLHASLLDCPGFGLWEHAVESRLSLWSGGVIRLVFSTCLARYLNSEMTRL